MFNRFKTEEQILDDFVSQYDGTHPDNLKESFIQKAESSFTKVLATEAGIKDALLSRESIILNNKRITNKDLEKIPLMQLLQTEGITIEARAGKYQDNPSLDEIVLDAAIWEASNQCGLPYYFAKIQEMNEDVDSQNMNSLNQAIQKEISDGLANKYKSLNPLEKFKHDDSLHLYQNLNYAFMVAATTTMVCGAFMSLPCLIIGFLSLALSMYIQQYLNDEIENRYMYKA